MSSLFTPEFPPTDILYISTGKPQNPCLTMHYQRLDASQDSSVAKLMQQLFDEIAQELPFEGWGE